MSDVSLDPNVVVAEIVKEVSKDMLHGAFNFGTKKFREIQVDFETCFTDYLARTYEQHSKSKTLVHGDKPVDLRSIYVATDFQEADKIIKGIDLLSHVIGRRKSIIFGTAGAGKSMLVKKLFLDLIDERTGYIPILIELRALSQLGERASIESLIFSQLRLLNENFTLEQLKYALKQGKFFLLFDGYDEISPDFRGQAESELLDISYQYSNSLLLVTSRFDESIKYWNEFYNISAVELTEESAIEIISRVEYDETVKSMFIGKLKSGLFYKHKEFLSNPLLLTIMLLTYESMAEIPESLHVFYEQAFLTLYHRHDATKRIFKRKLYAELPVDKFKKILSAFSAFTYCRSQYRFSRSEILNKLKQAIDSENIERVNPIDIASEDVLNDLIESICLIQQDGHEYIFSHRSFQEYFTAVFLSNTRSVDIGNVLEKLSKTSRSDKVLDILFEIDNELIETGWIKPSLDSFLAKIQEYTENGDNNKVAAMFVKSLRTDGSGFTDGPYMDFSHLLHRKYIYLAKNIGLAVRPFSISMVDVVCHGPEAIDTKIIEVDRFDSNCKEFDKIFPCERMDIQVTFLKHIQLHLSSKYAEKESDLARLLLGDSE